MAFDSPMLGGYQIINPPESINTFWEVVQQLNELADGGHRQRILGYRLNAELSWENNWIRGQDLTGLIAVANDTSASITFSPRPVTQPGLTFSVIWRNKFEFVHHDGHFGIYGGTIELISPTITSTVGALP